MPSATAPGRQEPCDVLPKHSSQRHTPAAIPLRPKASLARPTPLQLESYPRRRVARLRVPTRTESCATAVAAEIKASAHYAVVPDHVMRNVTVEKFLWEMAHEKPIRFTPQLGAGCFETVYRCALPNGLAVVVKVLHGGMDRRSKEHVVHSGGSSASASTPPLIYEYMGNGALDAYLFDRTHAVGVPALRAMREASGTSTTMSART
uniref:Protein kinase domain-containing protein n=1 Tax=Oryza punctata TaxID=4537 RepID=A0A0E0LGN9_ORYPU